MQMQRIASFTTPPERVFATVLRDTFTTNCRFVGHMFYKREEMSVSAAFTVKPLSIFLECIYEFVINTALPASNSVYGQNLMGKNCVGQQKKCLLFINIMLQTSWNVKLSVK